MPNPNYPNYPSVTQVLAPYAGFDRVRPDVLEAACARGTDTHTPCLAIASGVPFVFVKPELQGYVDSFRRWRDSMVDEVIAVEPALVHTSYLYTGMPDLIVRLKNETEQSVWDLKTSKSKGRVWCGQLAAYKELAIHSGYGAHRVCSLRLREDGSMPIADEYTYSDRDFAAFLSALNAWRYFNANL